MSKRVRTVVLNKGTVYDYVLNGADGNRRPDHLPEDYWDHVVESHEIHLRSLDQLKTAFEKRNWDYEVVDRDEFAGSDNADLVIPSVDDDGGRIRCGPGGDEDQGRELLHKGLQRLSARSRSQNPRPNTGDPFFVGDPEIGRQLTTTGNHGKDHLPAGHRSSLLVQHPYCRGNRNRCPDGRGLIGSVDGLH